MNFSQPTADIYVPTGEPASDALDRVTHLCIGAHQDDIEIMAHAGICACRVSPADLAFGGVVVTDGGGSPRVGPYAQLTDAQMREVRRDEQRTAARIGGYAIQLQLAHPSAVVKQGDVALGADLATILAGPRAPLEVVYLHNPADKHDTHIACFWRCLEALCEMAPERRPRQVLGCEVWRDLDWLVDADKMALDAGREPRLAGELLRAFDSQISGGKRYDLATQGRRLAHATFHTSHTTDRWAGITWAMDLTPLVTEPSRDPVDYTLAYLDRLRADVAARLQAFR